MLNTIIKRHSFVEMGIETPMATIINWNRPSLYDFDEIHSHEFWDILIFEKGGGTHCIDFQEYEINDYSIHIVSNNSTHRAERSIESSGFSIIFSPLYLNQLQQFDNGQDYLTFYRHSRVINFNQESFNNFKYILDELIKNQTDKSYFFNLLAAFLSKLITVNQDDYIVKSQDSIVQEFVNHINVNFMDVDCISEFISKKNITESVFRRKIKALTGKTPSQLFHEKVFLEAKKLLYEQKQSVKEIAFELGFTSETYFCRQFKNHENMTPVEFRKNVQKFKNEHE